MKNVLLIIFCLSFLSCGNVFNNRKKIETKKINLNKKKENKTYKIKVEWKENKVYQIKLDGKKIEKEGILEVKEGKHKLTWFIPSVKIALSASYNISRKSFGQDDDDEPDFSGGIGVNVKEIVITKDSYIYIDEGGVKVSDFFYEIPKETGRKNDKQFEILNTKSADENLNVIDKTTN